MHICSTVECVPLYITPPVSLHFSLRCKKWVMFSYKPLWGAEIFVTEILKQQVDRYAISFLSRCFLVKQKFWYTLHHHSCHKPFWLHKKSLFVFLLMLGGEQFKLPCAVTQNSKLFLEQRAGPGKSAHTWCVPAVPGEVLAGGATRALWGEAGWFQLAPGDPSQEITGPSGGAPVKTYIRKGEKAGRTEEWVGKSEHQQCEHQGESRMRGRRCSRCWNRCYLAAHKAATVKQKFMLQPLLRTHAGTVPGGLQEKGKDQQTHSYLVTINPIPHPPTPRGVGMLGESGGKLKLGNGKL